MDELPVYLVTTVNRSSVSGNLIFYNFECAISSLAEFQRMLNEGEFVHGWHLMTRKGDPGTLIVIGRRERVLSKHEISSVAMPTVRFLEAEAV